MTRIEEARARAACYLNDNDEEFMSWLSEGVPLDEARALSQDLLAALEVVEAAKDLLAWTAGLGHSIERARRAVEAALTRFEEGRTDE